MFGNISLDNQILKIINFFMDTFDKIALSYFCILKGVLDV